MSKKLLGDPPTPPPPGGGVIFVVVGGKNEKWSELFEMARTLIEKCNFGLEFLFLF
jgi:hypothetical protein